MNYYPSGIPSLPNLGFEVFVSPFQTENYMLKVSRLFLLIPSVTPQNLCTVMYRRFIDNGIDTIFYPCLSYNFDEGRSDNHYNCPVVAYYSEVIKVNMKDVRKITFINDYLGIHRKHDFPKKAFEMLQKYFDGITLKEVKQACKKAYDAYDDYMTKLRIKGEEIIKKARSEGKEIIVLVGRPYHVDPEINKGIDKLMSSFDVAIVSEDAICDKVGKYPHNCSQPMDLPRRTVFRGPLHCSL